MSWSIVTTSESLGSTILSSTFDRELPKLLLMSKMILLLTDPPSFSFRMRAILDTVPVVPKVCFTQSQVTRFAKPFLT
jgi:hypothetical protein